MHCFVQRNLTIEGEKRTVMQVCFLTKKKLLTATKGKLNLVCSELAQRDRGRTCSNVLSRKETEEVSPWKFSMNRIL